MATETKYRPTLEGSFLDAEGNKTDNSNEAVEFTTLTDLNNFIEASGSLGEYHIRRFTVKS